MGRPRVGPAVAAAMLAIAACSSGPGTDDAAADAPDTVAVASFNFPESELLAEIYSQSLEAGGYSVERILRPRAARARRPGAHRRARRLRPRVRRHRPPVPERGARRRRRPTRRRRTTPCRRVVADLPVRALAPAPAQDANAFVVDEATAERYGLESLSDLATVAGSLVFGGPPECASRPLCLVGLDEVYGITFGDVVTLDAGGPLTHQALDGGGIDVALLFTTDPGLDRGGLVELTDDRDLQPAENVTPLVHEDVAGAVGRRPRRPRRRHVGARSRRTSCASSTNRWRRASDIAAVAARWLAAEGLDMSAEAPPAADRSRPSSRRAGGGGRRARRRRCRATSASPARAGSSAPGSCSPG